VQGGRTLARATISGRRYSFARPAKGRYTVVIGAERVVLRVK
jgi:hypothetical protein